MVSKTFLQRISIGSSITLLAFLLIYYSHLPFLWIPFIASIVLITLFCLIEYFNILQPLKIFPEKTLLPIISLLYFAFLIFFERSSFIQAAPLLFVFATLVLTFLSHIIRKKISIISVALTLLGFIWITIPLATTYQINYFFPEGSAEKGQYWLLYVLFVTKMCDTAAYFVGSRFGKNPLAKAISPKKTVEGAIGGLLGALVTSYIFYQFSIVSIGLIESIILGIVVAFLTGIGDLAESILKRDAGVKDSSQLPGLGGVFDIMDSLLFTSPFIYLYLLLKWTV